MVQAYRWNLNCYGWINDRKPSNWSRRSYRSVELAYRNAVRESRQHIKFRRFGLRDKLE